MKKYSPLFLPVCFLAVLLIAPIPESHAQSTESETILILVRHAEKADYDTDDPTLTDEGLKRAQKLADMLERMQPDLIYSTDYKRTRLTVRPIALKHGLEIRTYNPSKLEPFLSGLLDENSGKTILISGHSNTIPETANLLLGREHFQQNFDESDYGNLLFITSSGYGNGTLIHLRY